MGLGTMKVKIFDGVVALWAVWHMSKVKEEFNIFEPLGLQGLQVLYCMESHENHMWLHGHNEG